MPETRITINVNNDLTKRNLVANESKVNINSSQPSNSLVVKANEAASLVELNRSIENLEKNHANVQKKINENFDFLKNLLETRRIILLNELNAKYHQRRANLVNKLDELKKQQEQQIEANENTNKLNNSKSNENSTSNQDSSDSDSINENLNNLDLKKLDEVDADSSSGLSNYLEFVASNQLPEAADTPAVSTTSASNITSKVNESLNSLTKLINSFGKISTVGDEPNKSNIIECTITGRGLKQCFVNEESSFTLSFKNREGNFAKSNVSFLDIFIIACNEASATSLSNAKESKEFLSGKRTISSSGTTNSNSSKQARALHCNCDCKLECLADGLYVVKYKLDRPGVFLLNVLVNKKHVGQSPYKLICIDSNKKTTIASEIKRKPISAASKTQSSYSISSSLNSAETSHGRASGVNANANNSPAGIIIKSGRANSISHIGSGTRTAAPNSNIPLYNGSSHKQNTFNLSLSNNNNNSNNTYNNTNYLGSNLKSNSTTNNSSYDDLYNLKLNHLSSHASLINPNLPKANLAKAFESSTVDFTRKEDDFLFKIGVRGRGNAEFMNPQAVCATNDYIYVTDSNNQKIDVFSHNGEFKFSLGSANNNSKIIKRPIGIDSTLDGKILVVDYEYKCVNVFEENGKFLNRICQNKLLGPKGICVNRNSQNQIIVADSKANSVCIFDSEGKFLHRFGNLGNKNENFAGPQYVATLSNADIVVTDFYNHCIKVFDPIGQFKFSFGSNGSNNGQFNGPTGIATDKNDNIIVVDWGNSRIQVSIKNCFHKILYFSFDLSL
jgi:hypothetical protein